MRAFSLYYYSGFKYRLDALLIVLILHYFRFRFERRKILFEDKKAEGSEQQIKFNGSPFIILGKKLLDFTNGVDHAISRKKQQTEEKVNNKVRIICLPKHWFILKFLFTSVLVYRKCFY